MKLMSQERLHLESVMKNSLCHWRGQISGILSRCLCHLFSDNYYTEAAKIIKEPPAALPKREFHVHRHSQACLRSTSTSSAAEFIYHREQYPEFPEFWWQIACWVSLQNENTIETQSTVNGLLFVMPKRKKERVSRRADDSIYIFIYIEAQPMDSKSEQS